MWFVGSHHTRLRSAAEHAAAATMLATTLGIDFDPETAWNERDQTFKMAKDILKTRNVVQSAEGSAKGNWSTVVALGVFIF